MATKRAKDLIGARAVEVMPDPGAIVRYYPNPLEITRAYVESEFHRELATEHERKVALVTAEGAAVTDAASYARVGERLVDVAAHRKDVEAWFRPLKDFAYRLHAMICARERDVLRPIVDFEAAAKSNRLALEREDERRRRAEADRLAEEARRLEQERLAAEARALEDRGEQALAAQVLEQAAATPPPVITIASTLPATVGIASRDRWTWQPIGGDTPANRARSVDVVAAWCLRMNRHPSEFLALDEKKLGAFARAHGASQRIPSIDFTNAGSVTVRT